MAKAILIMDMPESCDMCDLTDSIAAWGTIARYYTAPGIMEDVTDYTECRPDFCPLRESPEKKETVNPQECYINSYWTDEMKAGFNACVDEITGK